MIGKTLAHYEIKEQIGVGGMGEVYRAHDSRLGRDVAVKLLPPEFEHDAERLARFEREAKLLASLNHTNIATLYGLETDGNVHFLVMELVEGEDLAARITRGPLPLDDVIAVGVQVAAGLEAAHHKGIIHRDLKPGNIRLASDGTVKVLDFGLGKVFAEETGATDLSKSPTIISSGHTVAGVILGTAAYMSPEQARGKPVDARTDVWSFGCVLYECLTGKSTFPGETVTDTIAKILERDPDWDALPASVPPALRQFLRRALEKDPKRRWRDVGDAAIMLEQARGEAQAARSGMAPSDAAARPAAPARRGRSALWYMVGTFALLAAAVVYLIARGMPGTTGPSSHSTHLSFSQITIQSGIESYPSLSPDGNFVVYEATSGDNSDILLQRVGGQNPINLTEHSPDADGHPRFSPDGKQIAFRSDRSGGGIFIMGSTGESVRKLTDNGYHPDWSPDGRKIVFDTEDFPSPYGRSTRAELWVVDLATSETRRLFEGDAVQPKWSPHGDRIAYWSVEVSTGGQRDIATIAADGTDPVPVTSDVAIDWSPVWSPDGGFLYFASNRGGSMNIWRVAIDEHSGRVLGEPEAMTVPTSIVGTFDVSKDGRRIVYTDVTYRSNIARVGYDPRSQSIRSGPTLVTRGSLPLEDIDVSRDGKWIVARSSVQQEDIYLIRPDGSEVRKLTDDVFRDRGPSWSADGTRIAFYSDRSGRYELWSIRPDGSGLELLTQTTGRSLWFPRWSPDGKRIAAYNDMGSFIVDVTSLPVDVTTDSTNALPPTGHDPFQVTAWSPDGTSLAGWLNRSDGPGSVVLTYSLDAKRYHAFPLAERAFVLALCWYSDGKKLFVLTDHTLLLLDTRSGTLKQLLNGLDAGSNGLSATPDFSALYFTQMSNEGDLWLARME